FSMERECVGQYAAVWICVALGDLSPSPPGIFRFETAPAERIEARWVVRPHLAFGGVQAPRGARVASQRRPILRWSKGRVSRSRSRGGLYRGTREGAVSVDNLWG